MFCLNNGEPPSKSKNFLVFDSEIVPWGKDEIEFKKLKRNWNLMLKLVEAGKSDNVPFV